VAGEPGRDGDLGGGVTISLGLGENAIVFVDGANAGKMLMLHTMGAP
jgi:hypothetical protein